MQRIIQEDRSNSVIGAFGGGEIFFDQIRIFAIFLLQFIGEQIGGCKCIYLLPTFKKIPAGQRQFPV